MARRGRQDMADYKSVLIVGSGSGLSASLARLFASEGMRVALAARNEEKLRPLASKIGAASFACDAAKEGEVAGLFAQVEQATGGADTVGYHANARARAPLIGMD